MTTQTGRRLADLFNSTSRVSRQEAADQAAIGSSGIEKLGGRIMSINRVVVISFLRALRNSSNARFESLLKISVAVQSATLILFEVEGKG